MIRNILIPIENSSSFDTLVPYAVQVAKKFKAKLTLLQTYPIYHGTAAVGGYEAVASMGGSVDLIDDDELREYTENQLKNIPGLSDISYDLLVEPGTAHIIISSEFNELKPDLLIVSSESVVGLESFFGLEAEVLSRNVPCSTLVVPGDVNYSPYKKVALAIDKGKAKDEVALNDLATFLNRFEASFDAIHVTDEDQEDNEETAAKQLEMYNSLKIKLGNKNVTNFKIRSKVDDDITNGIKEYVRNNDIDLLVLLYRDHGFFKRIFNPGVRKQLIRDAETPMLILK